MDSIFIKCKYCDRSTGLLLKIKKVKEMRNKFVLNKNASCGFVLDNFFKQANEI